MDVFLVGDTPWIRAVEKVLRLLTPWIRIHRGRPFHPDNYLLFDPWDNKLDLRASSARERIREWRHRHGSDARWLLLVPGPLRVRLPGAVEVQSIIDILQLPNIPYGISLMQYQLEVRPALERQLLEIMHEVDGRRPAESNIDRLPPFHRSLAVELRELLSTKQYSRALNRLRLELAALDPGQ